LFRRAEREDRFSAEIGDNFLKRRDSRKETHLEFLARDLEFLVANLDFVHPDW
jgi:hypothetical protein